MEFVTILDLIVSVLILLTGFAVFVGSEKKNRIESFWFLIMTIGTALWGAMIGIFLSLPDDAGTVAPWIIWGLYTGAPIMLTGFVGYVGWRIKAGKAMTIFYLMVALVLSAILVMNPSVLYSRIALGDNGNTVTLAGGWFYWVYTIFCAATALTMLGFALLRLVHAKSHNEKMGLMTLVIGTTIAAIFITIFDLILPLKNYSLIWVGPLATGLNILFFYYEILRYHMIVVTTNWLKILSYIILMMAGACIYITVFYVVFMAIFHQQQPTTAVLVLNFVMITIMLLMIPIISEIGAFMKSLITRQEVDMVYVMRQLNKMATTNPSMRTVARFLAENMFFSYVGICIGGKVYGSTKSEFSDEEVLRVEKMIVPEGEQWFVARGALRKKGVVAVGNLVNGRGETFGKILIGQPMGKDSFDVRDLQQTETILNLVAAVIDSEKHLRV